MYAFVGISPYCADEISYHFSQYLLLSVHYSRFSSTELSQICLVAVTWNIENTGFSLSISVIGDNQDQLYAEVG